MIISNHLLLLASLLKLAVCQFGLGVQLFQLSGETSVNNAKLDWDTSTTPSATYGILRSDGTASAFHSLANVTANTYDDYSLPSLDQTYFYQVSALSSGDSPALSTIAHAQPFTPSQSYKTYDNTQLSHILLKPNLSAGGVYYQFLYSEYSNGSMSGITQRTSTDGVNFAGDTVVLTGQTVCASIENATCHLERLTFLQNPTTNQFVMWGHFENTANYGLAQVAVAYADPGKEFTFGGTYRPLGYDSRDLTFFADDDANAYLVSSFDTNTNMNIYSLTSNWTYVTGVVAEVYPKQYREAPGMAKSNGTYYLYTSRASGWYPSLPQYITATDLKGPWTDPKVMGNTATFATQSENVNPFADGRFMMAADRWSANWRPSNGPNRQLYLPMSTADGAPFATGKYYPSVQYDSNAAAPGQSFFGVQTGKIVSVGKSATSDAGIDNITSANDGVQTDPSAFFKPSKTPFWYQIDLGDAYQVTQVDLTTNMVQGSETYYGFNITGSNDGSSFDLLLDQSKNTDVGFVSSLPSKTDSYRYVRINVDSIINTNNGNSATWAAGIGEMTVYGKK